MKLKHAAQSAWKFARAAPQRKFLASRVTQRKKYMDVFFSRDAERILRGDGASDFVCSTGQA